MTPTSDEIRRTFIDYFASRGHTHVASSSLVPADDPTLLFTNAGMNQFKSVFLGEAPSSYPRAVTVQKCMRVSGKHNDLENVGPSLYHHTFFEMLGNFSFGDYFKAEAIRMAWQLFVEGFGLPKDRLWATVYEEDDEAERLWVGETDLPASRVVRLGKEDNYWSMGDTGPCGPCSELHYDYLPGDEAEPDFDSDRFVELWNLVFMQFNTAADGSVQPLPAPNIDTGAGLERLTAVLQGTPSNYDTDLFQPLIRGVADEVGVAYGDDAEADVALRAIADHSRALAFLVADGVMPANEGRGYVLRRLLRRAMRFGIKLGYDRPFLHESALRVVERMGEAYPELTEHRGAVDRVVRSEEERFLQTLSTGSRMFNELVERLKAEEATVIPGGEVFRLYDTHGLPIELSREFAEAEGLEIDEIGFAEALEAQRQRARSAWKGADAAPLLEALRKVTSELPATEFLGYETAHTDGARVVALLRDDAAVERLSAGENGVMIADRTPFYAESGGQVGDEGAITWPRGAARVTDTQRPLPGVVVHLVQVESGDLEPQQEVSLEVDERRRTRIRRNHTGTHLLHAALRNQLGDHVRQAGSLVEPGRLRFDFAHYEAIDPARLDDLETEINDVVRHDVGVDTEVMPYDDAIERGALAFFGEKYGDEVRVVDIPGVSIELCGGTHVARTGEIGGLVIQSEESVAAGTRRIEAVTGEEAVRSLQRYRGQVRQAAASLKAPEEDLAGSITRLVERAHEAEREVDQLRLRLASQAAGAGVDEDAVEVDGVKIVRREVDGLDSGGLRNLVDELKSKLGSGIVLVGMERDGKAALVVGVTPDVAARVGARDVVQALAPVLGGGGGGHAELAQAGGPDAAKVTPTLDRAPELIAELLK